MNFELTIGAEIRKTRPAVILQNDIGNRFGQTTIVAAVTSKFGPKRYPTEILVEPPDAGLRQSSVVLLDQIRTVDKQRLARKLGRLRSETMERVERALQVSLGLITL